jgi:hypothetical protein
MLFVWNIMFKPWMSCFEETKSVVISYQVYFSLPIPLCDNKKIHVRREDHESTNR